MRRVDFVLLVDLFCVSLCVYLVGAGMVCQKAAMLVYVQVVKVPVVLVALARVVGWMGAVAAVVSSVVVFWVMAFVVGAFSWENWIVTGMIVGPVALAPVVLDGWTCETMLSLFGFVAGAVPFPLDWPVCWKEAPVAHCVLFAALGFVGAVMDCLKGGWFSIQWKALFGGC